MCTTPSFLIATTYLFVLTITCHGLSNKIVDETVNHQTVIRTQSNFTSDDDNLNITELSGRYGYEIEEHSVVTEDGYILSLHRIPSKKPAENNSAILLMHGILDASDSWILQGPNHALAYELVDKGYDVWMGNARGNKHSCSHITLDNKSSEFWKFSWEEIGLYDLPAMIDYVLMTMNMESLYYVGHSQGTTAFFAMLALKPEYNHKVNLMFALAPVTWTSNARSPIFKLFTVFKYWTSNNHVYAANIQNFGSVPKFLCKFLPTSCDNALQWIVGTDYKLIYADLVPVIYRHFPSDSSTMQFIHYGQMFQSGRFCRFDFGAKENLIKYGDVSPPDYDLTKVNVPVVLFYSTNDWLSDVQDVKHLFAKLPNVYDSYDIEKFNHVDYMYANTAKELVYSNILNCIDEFKGFQKI